MWLLLWLLLSLVPAPVPQSAPAAPPSSKIWIGRYAEFEEFIKSARIERMVDVGSGVTRPKHAFFTPGGLSGGAVVKDLPPGKPSGYWESYKSEIAAYKLDRLLELDMVPPTVERTIDGHDVAVQLWVDDTRVFKQIKGEKPASGLTWIYQVNRQRLFDNLTNNVDENEGNMLIDRAWNMILLDHSRCFTVGDKMNFPNMTLIDRPLFDSVKALDKAVVEREIGGLLQPGAVESLMKRRDIIVSAYEKLAKQKGEGAVFMTYKPPS